VRLDPRFRLAVYAAFSILFATGAGWLLADRMMKDASGGEAWQTASAYLLMLHGGAAMVMLMLLGAIIPLHAQRGWRSGRNRLTATAMVALNGTLVVTSFGLYYAGSETMRPWMSDIHTALGLLLPVLLFVHVFIGRRGSPQRRIL
jgi:Ni,Fe-hydrogenase I cytochrome b subunit